MFSFLTNISSSLDLFARAGGGGSSSGGDGSGIIALIGYAPMHFICAFIRKKMINSSSWIIAQVVGWTICGLFCLVLFYFLGGVGLYIGAGAVCGTGAGLYNWFSKLWRSKKTTEALKHSEALDPTWNEEAILARAKEIFMRYQTDWTARNWQRMAEYMTPHYYQHATLMTVALKQAKRIDNVENPVVDQMAIVGLNDSDNNDEDTVKVGIIARANDILIDEISNTTLFTDKRPFTEYWSFKRKDNIWYLDSIEQATASSWQKDLGLQKLAKDHGFFYSLDWGWLLIPKRGRLFGSAKFGVSDINNHIIGVYNNTYLLQLYTYDPVPNNSGSYLIAQTNVPKEYGDIVVRRKKWNVFFTPKGLEKISMEWGDFNKKYEVFASKAEGVTSFELLHPAFMEKLEALPFEVNIEVVDNVVYLYASRTTAKNPPGEYEIMLNILQEAYKQMKL